MDKRTNRLVFALMITIVYGVVIAFLYNLFRDDETLNRILIALGGNVIGGGYIQCTTLFMFVWGLLEIKNFLDQVTYEQKFFNKNLLPEDEFALLDDSLVNEIRVKAAGYLRKYPTSENHKNYLLHLINKSCTKYRANSNSSEAYTIVTNQSRLNLSKSESEQSYIRYIGWAIPSIGFIGTVIGISLALNIAATGKIEEITSTLGLAFDTTLFALVLSVILMYLYNVLQEKNERLQTDIEEYVTDNLINRIDND